MNFLLRRVTIGTKLFATLIFVAMLFAATLFVVEKSLRRHAANSLASEYERSTKIVHHKIVSEFEQLRTGLVSMVDSPETKALLTTDGIDHDTLLYSVNELQMILRADLVMYIDMKGHSLARTDDPFEEKSDLSDLPLIQQAISAKPVRGVLRLDGERFIAYSYPVVLAEDPRGIVIAAVKISDEFTEKIKATLLRDVVLADGDEIIAGTLSPDSQKAAYEAISASKILDQVQVFQSEHTFESDTHPSIAAPWLTVAETKELLLQSIPATELAKEITVTTMIPFDAALGPFQRLREKLIAFGTCSLVGGLLASILIVRSVSTNVRRILGLLESVAQGDLSQRLKIKSHDEFGRMAKALNTAIEASASTLKDVQSASKRELEAARQREELQRQMQEKDADADAINQRREMEREYFRQQQRGSEAVMNGMSMVRSDVEESVEAMARIRSSANNITQITDVISSIAAQTNLLSLNAKIEAVRAGAHGAGFCVVADEVRDLARASDDAAKKIEELIDESVQRIEQGTELSHKISETLRSVGDEAQQQLNQIRDRESMIDEFESHLEYEQSV